MKFSVVLGSSLFTLLPGMWATPMLDPGSGHFYELITTTSALSWVDANAQAEARSYQGLAGHLASVTSSAESDFIYQNLLASYTPAAGLQNYAWIGGHKVGGNWAWTDGDTWSWENWAANQPDNYLGDENYLQMLTGPWLGRWNDNENNGHGTYFSGAAVVEYANASLPVAPVPDSGSTLGLACASLFSLALWRRKS